MSFLCYRVIFSLSIVKYLDVHIRDRGQVSYRDSDDNGELVGNLFFFRSDQRP